MIKLIIAFVWIGYVAGVLLLVAYSDHMAAVRPASAWAQSSWLRLLLIVGAPAALVVILVLEHVRASRRQRRAAQRLRLLGNRGGHLR